MKPKVLTDAAGRPRLLTALAMVLLAGACLARPALAAEKPLSSDDVTLMLLAGASTDKMLAIIAERGIDFRMNPDLAQKFHNAGADDLVIEALQKAVVKPPAAAPQAPPPAPPAPAGAPPPASAAVPAAASEPARTTPPPPAKPAAAPAKAMLPALPDPSPEEIQKIIQEFAAKEKVFKEARANYTYHQFNKVSEFDTEGNPGGKFEQEWDILFDDSGKRIERVTYAPPPTLRWIIMTKEDLEGFRSVQPFVLTTDELPEYDVKYLGHVRVDEITAYVFDVRPKEIKKGRVYFQGRVWVDDRDLQIVKSEGKQVPQITEGKQMNLFPRFTTYREQIDGKFWFPTYTMADDTLYFATPIRVKMVIRYTDYKQFKSRVRILSAEELKDEPAPSPAAPAAKTPDKKKKP
jgi:hypothetical protein